MIAWWWLLIGVLGGFCAGVVFCAWLHVGRDESIGGGNPS